MNTTIQVAVALAATLALTNGCSALIGISDLPDATDDDGGVMAEGSAAETGSRNESGSPDSTGLPDARMDTATADGAGTDSTDAGADVIAPTPDSGIQDADAANGGSTVCRFDDFASLFDGVCVFAP